MTITNDEGEVISEKDAIVVGLVIMRMDASKMEDSDFKRALTTIQKLALKR